MNLFLRMVMLTVSFSGCLFAASGDAASDKRFDELEKSLHQSEKSMEEKQRAHFGEIRTPKNPQEWMELDAVARIGPEECYRWLQLLSDQTLIRTLRGKTWEDLGESNPVAACRKIASLTIKMEKRQVASDLLGHLAKLRSALALYYGDHNGVYPEFLDQLVPKYLPAVPPAYLDHHPETDANVRPLPRRLSTDTGGWGYVGEPSSPDYGTIIINCTHTHGGKPLSDY